MEKTQSIEIKCKGAGELPITYLSRLQGDLKILTDTNYQKLKNQILTEGFNFPIAIWEDKETSNIYTIDGNQRVETLNRMRNEGYKIPQIPIVWVEAENLNQAKRKLLGGASQYGQFNQKGAEDFISTIEGIDIEYLNQNLALNNIYYENIEFNKTEEKIIEVAGHQRTLSAYVEGEDDVPEIKESKVKLGDIFQLGNHRLVCGDSTKIENVEKLMDGNYCDITFTSPPYNAAKNGHLTGNVSGFDKKYQQHSDELSDDDYLGLLAEFTSIAIAKSKYCFVNIQLLTHNRGPLFKYQEQFQSLIKDILIWNKKQCPPNIVKGAFNTKWEYIFCFSEDKKTRGFPCSWQGQFPNVVETESNAANEFADTHKAGFPVALPSWFIEKFDFAKTIYDPFGGTGTTMIAAEKTNRKCFMMELDPHYCSVIIERWQKFTGQQAIRLNQDGSVIVYDDIKQTILRPAEL